MPKFPHFAERLNRIQGSVFEKYRSKMKEKGPYMIHLHIGDTYLHPKFNLPVDSEFLKKRPYFNRYCNTFGVERFRRAAAEKLNEDNGFTVDSEQILATSGATNALSASVISLLDPDEEILILTPCWPFFPGMVKVADARGIEVPFYTELYTKPDLNITAYLKEFMTPNTVALYLNTPNNPSGKVLTRHQLEQLADFAKYQDLWIISDEAYDGLIFDGHEQICIGTLPEMHQRTISIFTFSKSFMFAGLRLGYLTSDAEVVKEINKVLVHQVYSPSTLSQYMMVEPLKHRQDWIPKLCMEYQELRDMFIEKMQIPVICPEGTYFLFFSIQAYLRGRKYWEVIDQLIDAGVAVAPGVDFGSNFKDYIRICFTGEPPERLEKAIERLNEVLA
ncbi:MAG: pyridoxal phosphate-dependent aminotransferase [Calditrichaeota bacterium]|nr:pyridoxal phosphate-dependent aminotransferase [Calditrichota bacterium]